MIYLQALDKFTTDRVSIIQHFGNSCTTQTYNNFTWCEDVDYLVMGDSKTLFEDAISINMDDIVDIEANEKMCTAEIILVSGKMTIILDTDYSLCFKCKEKRPVFYMRAIGEKSEGYDIRVCQDCFEKMIECWKIYTESEVINLWLEKLHQVLF